MIIAHDLDSVMPVAPPAPLEAKQLNGAGAAEDTESTDSNAATASIPALENLPGAEGVLYLDFDGESGPFPGWAFSGPAESAEYDEATIEQIWQRVAVDFEPFNLNVTTSLAVFEAAPPQSRQHCLVTPDFGRGNIGGVSLIGTFNLTDDVVCWTRNYLTRNAAEIISHELGHTLGLRHDGNDEDAYYGGCGSGRIS